MNRKSKFIIKFFKICFPCILVFFCPCCDRNGTPIKAQDVTELNEDNGWYEPSGPIIYSKDWLQWCELNFGLDEQSLSMLGGSALVKSYRMTVVPSVLSKRIFLPYSIAVLILHDEQRQNQVVGIVKTVSIMESPTNYMIVDRVSTVDFQGYSKPEPSELLKSMDDVVGGDDWPEELGAGKENAVDGGLFFEFWSPATGYKSVFARNATGEDFSRIESNTTLVGGALALEKDKKTVKDKKNKKKTGQ